MSELPDSGPGPADAAAPPGRACWSGLLTLGLLAVPIKAYPATATAPELPAHLVHAGCGRRLRYDKRCPDHGTVEAAAVVKSYEYAPGRFVVLDEADLDRTRPRSRPRPWPWSVSSTPASSTPPCSPAAAPLSGARPPGGAARLPAAGRGHGPARPGRPGTTRACRPTPAGAGPADAAPAGRAPAPLPGPVARPADVGGPGAAAPPARRRRSPAGRSGCSTPTAARPAGPTTATIRPSAWPPWSRPGSAAARRRRRPRRRIRPRTCSRPCGKASPPCPCPPPRPGCLSSRAAPGHPEGDPHD